MAFTGIAALAAGTVTTATVLSAVAEVGTVMTVVGGITGSKDLMQVGSVMGLAGGIGGAIAGGADAAATAGVDSVNSFDSGAMQGLVNGASADTGASFGAANALSDTSTAGASPDLSAPETTSVATPAQTMPVAPQTPTSDMQAIGGPADSTPSVNLDTTSTPVTQPSTTQGPTFQTGAQAPLGPQAPLSPADDLSTPAAYQRPNIINGAPSDSGSYFSRFSDWANKNKVLVNSGVQLAGGALKGMNDRSMWDQQMGLKTAQFNRANSAGTFAPTTIPPGGIIGKVASS